MAVSNRKELNAIDRRIAVKKDGLLAGYQLLAKIQTQLDELEDQPKSLLAKDHP